MSFEAALQAIHQRNVDALNDALADGLQSTTSETDIDQPDKSDSDKIQQLYLSVFQADFPAGNGSRLTYSALSFY